MPKYKVVDTDQLDADLTSVADAIRAKGNTSEPLDFPSGLVDAVSAIQVGGKLQSKTVAPSHSEQIIAPDEDYYGLVSVTVKPVPKLKTATARIFESADGFKTGIEIGTGTVLYEKTEV